MTVQLTMFGIAVEELRPAAEIETISLDFESHPIRMIMIKGQPWWILADLARVLGYRDAEQAGRLLRERHKGTTLSGTPGIQSGMLLVSEAGLYRIMMRSDKPVADRFQDWITDEVLPSIRRTGSYTTRSRSRLARVAKKIKADQITAQSRCEVIDINRNSNQRLASEGACQRDFVTWHNGRYQGFFGQKAKELRKRLNLKDYQTPLDRMSGLALSQSHHAIFLAEKRIAEHVKATGQPMTFVEQAEVLEDSTRDIAGADFEKLGTGWIYGIVDDPRRGPVIDVIRAQLEAS